MTWYLFKKFIFSHRSGSLIRRIAWLSLLAISLGIAAFLLVLFIMSGMNVSIEKRIIGIEPHLVITSDDFKTSSDIEKNDFYKMLQTDDKVKNSIFESQDVILRSMDGKFRGAQARGVTESSLALFYQNLNQLNSTIQPFSYSELPGIGEIFIGVDLAQILNVFEGDYLSIVSPEDLLLPLGEAPKIEKVRIKKIITTNIPELDSQVIMYDRNLSLKNLQGLSRQLGVELWYQSKDIFDQATKMKDSLSNQKNLKVETWMDRNSTLFYSLMLEKLMIGVFLGLAALVAGSSILTVLSLLIFQKTKEIAIFKTMGMSRKTVLLTFTKIGTLLSGIGIFTGVFIGTVLGLYLQYFPLAVLPDIFYDSTIPAKVNFTFLGFVVLISIILSILGSYVPSLATQNIEPSEALKAKN